MEILKIFNATPVQRNSGIDGFLKEYINGKPISIKIQREEETLEEAMAKLIKASTIKRCSFMILIRTHIDDVDVFHFNSIPDNMRIINSYEMHFEMIKDTLNQKVASNKESLIQIRKNM